MGLYARKSLPGRNIQFNVTPLLDVVLLLVIFFMLACDFIRRETFPLAIPENCLQARSADPTHLDALTVSIFPPTEASSAEASPPPAESPTKNQEIKNIIYAVRDIQFNPQDKAYQDNPDKLISDMAGQIKRLIGPNPDGMVHLRAHRDVPYGQVQKTLIALSRAGVHKVHLAAQRTHGQ
jgi:biopolymer transport protein ExbD